MIHSFLLGNAELVKCYSRGKKIRTNSFVYLSLMTINFHFIFLWCKKSALFMNNECLGFMAWVSFWLKSTSGGIRIELQGFLSQSLGRYILLVCFSFDQI